MTSDIEEEPGNDIEVTVRVVNNEDQSGAMRLRFVPRVGDFIDHEIDHVSHLYRVIGVALPSNPVSELQTFDVFVVDEGLFGGALERLLALRGADTAV